MAQGTYDNEIGETMNWGGCPVMDGLPVEGSCIQSFIKESLNNKAGVFYFEQSHGRYLVFADEYDKDAYLRNKTNSELILGVIDLNDYKGPDKGLFLNEQSLKSAYILPQDGWWALVGITLPAQLYFAKGGEWIGATDNYGNPQLVDLGVSLRPRMEVSFDGDYFMAFGERKTVRCRVYRGDEDVTSDVGKWEVTRKTGKNNDDLVWKYKSKVQNFKGELELCFTEEENDLGSNEYNECAVFTFTAYMNDGEMTQYCVEF